MRDHHVLWEISGEDATTSCVMVSCCSGAELQDEWGTYSQGEEK